MIINDQQTLANILTTLGGLLPPEAKTFLNHAVKMACAVEPSISVTPTQCYWTAISAIGSGVVDNKTGTEMVHSVMLCWPMDMAVLADVMVTAEWCAEFPNSATRESREHLAVFKRECLSLVN